jgi:hypothetical protein
MKLSRLLALTAVLAIVPACGNSPTAPAVEPMMLQNTAVGGGEISTTTGNRPTTTTTTTTTTTSEGSETESSDPKEGEGRGGGYVGSGT